MRILVVEDEQKVADALREGLEDERYDVVVERTGEGAFFRVNTETFDVVLLDLTLPGRDGLEILRHIKNIQAKTGRGASARDLALRMKRKNYSPDMINKALKTMEDLDWIDRDKTKGQVGRPTIRWTVAS